MTKPLNERIAEKEAKLKAAKARLSRMKAQESSEKRKLDTRVKILVGAAVLADAAMHNEIARIIVKILDRAVLEERNRTVLAQLLAGDFSAYAKADKGKAAE